jgi:hypothetical protein
MAFAQQFDPVSMAFIDSSIHVQLFQVLAVRHSYPPLLQQRWLQ